MLAKHIGLLGVMMMAASAVVEVAALPPRERDFKADDSHEVDADVPANMPTLDKPKPEDNPSAQSVSVPQVIQSGLKYTWSFNDMGLKTLGPFGVIADSWGSAVPNLNRYWVPDPLNPSKLVLRVNYPAGTSNPTSTNNPPNIRGGTGFYAKPISSVITRVAKSITLEYSVYFPPNFNFVRGGKLPGLYGSTGLSKGCSGGNDAEDCFSTRYMWRRYGDGELYLYAPTSASQDPEYCVLPPYSFCDPAYGDSIGRGAIKFKPGTWTKLTQTITLNTPKQRNGSFKLSVNGVQVLSYNKMVWRVRPDVAVEGIVFQTFFGGSTPDWATPTDQFTLYKDFSMTAQL